MRRFKLTYHLLVVLMSVVSFSGCSQEEYFEKQDTEQSQVEAQLILSLSLPQSSTRAASPTTLPGTSEENKCNKITLFIISADNTSIQDYTIAGENLENKQMLFNIADTQGKKNILVAANMSEAQIAEVKKAFDYNPSLTINDIKEITTENGCLMTGQAYTEDNNETITIEANQMTKIKATLTRVMSKVLLTCTTKTINNIEYVNLAENNGYIRLNNIHYVLQTTNKKFFPFAKTNNEDPNFAMNETLNKDYSFNFFDTTINEINGETAVKYESNRLVDGENRYTEGLYCLENTISDINGDFSDDLSTPKKVATYLKIAAKFTPKNINGQNNLTEDQAMGLLSGGTFYTCRKAPTGAKEMCYSSKAEGIRYLQDKHNLTVTDNDFTGYEGGWQRYETFLNSPTDFNANASVVRSNYYILNVTSFTAPLVDKTIEVNTTIVGWVNRGTTTVDIETGNNK